MSATLTQPTLDIVAAYRRSLLCRLVDDKMSKMVRQNKGGTFHLCINGHELIGVFGGMTLVPGKDWGLPYYRDRGFALGLGVDTTELFAAFLARDVKNHSGGKQMPEHYSDVDLRIPCQSSVVGSQFLQATGVALSAKLSGKDEIVYVSAGDGATSQGDFHEALNFAALHKLGVLFVIQDNDWAISVPRSEQMCNPSIAERAKNYTGLATFEIDGTDPQELLDAYSQAATRARAGEGPALIVAKVPRIGAHSISDDPKKYKSIEHVEEDEKRDPLPRFEKWLIENGHLTQEQITALHAEVKEEVETAAKEAEEFPKPDSENHEVFAPHGLIEKRSCPISKTDIVIVDAINHALHEELESDRRVVAFGQDVAHGKGGVFGVTAKLTETFGTKRCFNTPLAESTISGIAMGLSMAGYRPVAEMQFSDYMWTGINQIFNEISSLYYRSNGLWNCPLVIRMPCGGYIQGGPYHSQSVEAFLAHCPGLKIAIPSNAADAKRLMKAAIRDPNPVIFLEHKALYRQRLYSAKPEPAKEDLLPLGKAHIVHEGEDLTLITYGMLVPMAFEIANQLAKEGISLEVIDLRTIVPLDRETILTSVKKTGKVLIAHEAVKHGGFGAEIAAQISEELFPYLDAPIKRIGARNCPVPYNKEMEASVLPQKSDIEKAVKELASY
ncbi:MAG: thiamine pyrophosphate-dependent enzyme [Candidatus Algichlamydia australiensis]|nr:thiamine pyrophosphate-dependent enzyme [Chlamydiales bacterium]